MHPLQHPEWLKPEIIPGFPYLRWYGLMYILAAVTTFLLFKYQVKKRALDLNKDTVINAFFWGMIGLLVGARVFYMVFFDTTGALLRAPWTLLVPIEGCQFTGYQGMNFYGGVVGAAVAMIMYLRFKKQDILEWADLLVIGFPLGHTFGRIGNFINGELYGRLTDAPWGMIFKETESYKDANGIAGYGVPLTDPHVKELAAKWGIDVMPGQTHLALPRHPTQIYSMLFECLAIWAVLWFVFRNRKPFKGFILAMYLLLYGVVRFVLDYFRLPLRNELFLNLMPKLKQPYLLISPVNFSLDQLFSFLMIVAGVILLVLFSKRAQRGTLAPVEGDQKLDLRKMRKKIEKEEVKEEIKEEPKQDQTE